MALNDTNTHTNTTTPPSSLPYTVEEPHQLTTIRIIVFSLIICLGLFGNTVVIRAIRSGRSQKPFTHYLVTCLAIAELLNSLCLIFVFVYDEMWHWTFGNFLCHLVPSSVVLSFGVTTSTLACISVYRYQVIVTPHKKPPSKRVIMGILTGIWIISFAITLPLYLLYVNQEVSPGYYECFVEYDLRIYDLVRIAFQFFLPVFIMIVSYTVAAVKIKEHMKFVENRRRESRLNSNISSLNTYLESQLGNGDNNLLMVPQHPHYKQVVYLPNTQRGSVCHINRVPADQVIIENDSKKKRKSISPDKGSMIESERDIIKMFYVIILVFLVCYIPYQVFFLCSFYNVLNRDRHPYFDLLRKYTVLLTTFPSALHPLCYGTMSHFYARAFSKLVLCKIKK